MPITIEDGVAVVDLKDGDVSVAIGLGTKDDGTLTMQFMPGEPGRDIMEEDERPDADIPATPRVIVRIHGAARAAAFAANLTASVHFLAMGETLRRMESAKVRNDAGKLAAEMKETAKQIEGAKLFVDVAAGLIVVQFPNGETTKLPSYNHVCPGPDRWEKQRHEQEVARAAWDKLHPKKEAEGS